jgi:5-formyltetrahydrofolate cyclo-ligase
LNKDQLRVHILEKRRRMTNEEVSRDSRLTYAKLVELGSDFFGDSVFIYVSFDNEIDTHRIIEYLLDKDIEVSVPLVIPDVKLEAIRIEALSHMKGGSFGILEPLRGEEVPKESIKTVIVPGVVFDRDMNRIGLGKGYYDGFLKDMKAKKVALAHKFQVLDTIPSYPWDVKMDMIIAGGEIIHPRGKNP